MKSLDPNLKIKNKKDQAGSRKGGTKQKVDEVDNGSKDLASDLDVRT